MKLFNKIKNYCGAVLFVGAAAVVTLNSCTEKIDESDLYTFTGETMLDHLENNPEVFSSYLTVLGKVHTSKNSSSTVRELLGARGEYTCFAPTNEAVQEFLDSLYQIGLLESNLLEEISDSVAEVLVFNSIIENKAYSTAEFQSTGPLPRTNMNDRYISMEYRNDADNNTLIYVYGNSLLIEGDIEVENGVIHTVDKVLSPSSASVADLLIETENMTFFGNLIKLTGWSSKVLEFKDEAWEDKWYKERGTEISTNKFTGMYPEHRYIGYTIFAEPNEVYESYNITDITSLKEWVKANNHFDDDTNMGHATSWGDDYTNDYNWLNQFVAYHILPEVLTYNNMVTFANEFGRTAEEMRGQEADGSLTKKYYVNVWEYWETMGIQRRSLKITATQESGNLKRRINRVSVYNNGAFGSYQERRGEITIPGIEIYATNGEHDNYAINGYYYPISDILIWNADVPQKVLNERMRYDVASMFPELLTNNIRQNRHNGHGNWYITTDYLGNIVDMAKETEFWYLPNQNYEGGTTWNNYQIDEFNINGVYDFTMKLPPVPYSGVYEIRYGINSNQNRGMAQVYIGTNKNNLPAIGIPLDLRDLSGCSVSNTGWVAEGDLKDEFDIQENTKSMRNLGFMKGPKYLYTSAGNGRTRSLTLRKIIYMGYLEAGKTYYIRFKSVLDTKTDEFFYDYLEFVPKTIYEGEKPEDVW